MGIRTPHVEQLLAELEASRLPPPAVRRSLRVSAGISCRQLGGLTGVTATTVSRWERGAQPRVAHAIQYREVLDALRNLS